MAETTAAVIASANNLFVKYGTQVVLDGATIAFTEGEHIGLVGRNGSGKSTFLRIAAGEAQADSGEFTRRRRRSPRCQTKRAELSSRPPPQLTYKVTSPCTRPDRSGRSSPSIAVVRLNQAITVPM